MRVLAAPARRRRLSVTMQELFLNSTNLILNSKECAMFFLFADIQTLLDSEPIAKAIPSVCRDTPAGDVHTFYNAARKHIPIVWQGSLVTRLASV